MALVAGSKRTVAGMSGLGAANAFAAGGNQLMAKVLLIEDDSETAEEITAELADRGFEVEWSANGIEGLDKARSSARRHDRRSAVARNGRPHGDRSAAEGAGAHTGAGAERARRGGRSRTRIADGWRRLSHQAIRGRRTRRQNRSIASPAGGIARDDIAGRAAGTRSDRAHRQTRRSRDRSAAARVPPA